jgi:hypothetical protein
MVQYGIDLLRPPIISTGGGIGIVGFLVFWALFRTRSLIIATKHSLLFFAFALLYNSLSLHLPMCVSPTVSSAQSARDDLPVILCKVLGSSPSVTNLLGMGGVTMGVLLIK